MNQAEKISDAAQTIAQALVNADLSSLEASVAALLPADVFEQLKESAGEVARRFVDARMIAQEEATRQGLEGVEAGKAAQNVMMWLQFKVNALIQEQVLLDEADEGAVT